MSRGDDIFGPLANRILEDGHAELDRMEAEISLRDPRDTRGNGHDEPESPRTDASVFTYVGHERYTELRSRPEPRWTIPSLLRRGKVTVLGGASMTGKSWFDLQIGSAIAAGEPPWPGMEPMEAGVWVKIGYDPHMTVEDMTRRLDQLDRAPHRAGADFPVGAWEDRMVLVGHSEEKGPFPVDRYRLDACGCERLREEIFEPIIKERGPIAGISIDTLSTALPEGVDENKSSDMTPVITRMSMLALDLNASLISPHHPTKAASSAGTRDTFNPKDPFSYFRGSGAIPNAAGVLAGLWRPPDRTYRVLTCWSNSGHSDQIWFQVCTPERAPQDAIDFWIPTDAPEGRGSEDEDLDEGAELEALARAFPEPGLRIPWSDFVKKTEGAYNGASRRRATARLERLAKSLMADREEKDPKRVFLTSQGEAKVGQYR